MHTIICQSLHSHSCSTYFEKLPPVGLLRQYLTQILQTRQNLTFAIAPQLFHSKAPSIKYVTLEGEGSEKVWQFVTGGGGQEHVTSRLYKFLSYIWNLKFKVMFNFLL